MMSAGLSNSKLPEGEGANAIETVTKLQSFERSTPSDCCNCQVPAPLCGDAEGHALCYVSK